MSVLDLLRPDLRAFAGYTSARKTGVSGRIWLNANESPWANPGDAGARCNRYPAPQPEPLRQALAELYEVHPEQLLIGRGSDEAIDLLVRALCRPERDAVVTASPVFGMYAVSARLQNAPLIDIPLVDGRRVSRRIWLPSAMLRWPVARTWCSCARLVTLPARPRAGGYRRSTSRLSDKAVVVVDEAMANFPTCLRPRPSYIRILPCCAPVRRTLAAARITP